MIQFPKYFDYCLGVIESVIYDYIKRLILLSVIQLSGGHCINNLKICSDVFISEEKYKKVCLNLRKNEKVSRKYAKFEKYQKKFP